MLKELVKIANRLDYLGLQKEADIIDSFIRKASGEEDMDQKYRKSLIERLVNQKLEFYLMDNPEATKEELEEKKKESIDLANHMLSVSYRLATLETRGLLHDIFLDDRTTKEDLDRHARALSEWDRPSPSESMPLGDTEEYLFRGEGGQGNSEYTVVKLYKMDGETPETSLNQEMVGGSREEPVLEWVKSPIIISVKGGIGYRFPMKSDAYSMTKNYEVVELGTGVSPGKAVRV